MSSKHQMTGYVPGKLFFSRKCHSRNDKCMELNLSSYQDTSCTTYTTPMNSACSTKIFQRKPFTLKDDKYSGGKDSKVLLTGMVSASGAGEKLPMFVISKLARCFKNQDASKMSKAFHVVINCKEKS